MKFNIIEGADYVGKSAVSSRLGVKPYHPDYTVFDKYFDRNLAFMYGYGQVDLLFNKFNNNELSDSVITWDRGLFSSYAYSVVYNSKEIPLDIIDDYVKKLTLMGDVNVYYVKHKDYDSAKRILSSDKNHNDKLDKFDSFSDYWCKYIKLCDAYDHIIGRYLDRTNFNIFKVITESNREGTRVNTLEFKIY